MKIKTPYKLRIWFSEESIKKVEEDMQIINNNLCYSEFVRAKLNDICRILRIKRLRRKMMDEELVKKTEQALKEAKRCLGI